MAHPTDFARSLSTITVSEAESALRQERAGTRLLARAVIRLAIHDLGAWCKHCRNRPQACPKKCHELRTDAITFLRGEEPYEAITTLELWSAHAEWPTAPIKEFFSRGNEKTWIPFVIDARAPYRRARRGASAPEEASFYDLWQAYCGTEPVVLSPAQ